ncbi:TIGR03842 family LLM class F420-dependent oxidoreductase [Oerskovia sp. Root22]|uniref:TIGR03842 family LLM class F420-dependent oxidoreductase n=1 Tax=Oerskovia sp. Root22 TaxID=1736494 RepID=UPI0006FADD48|nr:TIGR03842 family LLM class F420-dependent oxidoreductase [Oerskovia sp. Root22]KRC35385.1 LLM class F420-dependent oxidoreductase [Oerskovia sp. Root22]
MTAAGTAERLDLGVVLQTNPPAWRVVDLARRAELHGFSHVWTFDSHLLWQEPFVIYSQILSATHRVTVGPMVTNPATRDVTVTASLFATLNDMFGNRTVCGIGRGDSAVRVTNGKPVTLAELRAAVTTIRGLAGGQSVEYHGTTLHLPWAPDSRTPVWVAAYGPRALALAGEVGDGFILQLADPDIVAWSIDAVRQAAEQAGRDPAEVTICVAAPAYVTGDSASGTGTGMGGSAGGRSLAHAYDQCRWFGGMVGNHVAEIVARYGAGESTGTGPGGDADPRIPRALTDFVAGRVDYDYNEHGRAGNTHTAFVSDEIVDRFCLVGPPERHVERLLELKALGVDQFALYLQHDANDETLQAYGELVRPAVQEAGRVRG